MSANLNVVTIGLKAFCCGKRFLELYLAPNILHFVMEEGVITQEELDNELGITEADLKGWKNVE